MKLVNCGDSWAWGSELLDPKIYPFNGEFKDHNLHYLPENEKWRLDHRYIGLLAKKLNADIVDLSLCAFSNEGIIRTLLRWLAHNDYLSGNKDTSELFVIIGWTSPERREHMYSGINKERIGNEIPGILEASLEPWTFVGPWSTDLDYPDYDSRTKKFMKLYAELFWDPKEFIMRYYISVFMIQSLLKQLNIKHLMYQSFYHNPYTDVHNWKVDMYKETILNTVPLFDKAIWESISTDTFLLKKDSSPTFRDYILNKVKNDTKKVFYVWHPNELGHKIWADYLFDHIKKNKLC